MGGFGRVLESPWSGAVSTALVPAAAEPGAHSYGESPFALSVIRVLVSDPWPADQSPELGDSAAEAALLGETESSQQEPAYEATYLACLAGLTFGGSWNELVARVAADLATSSQSTPIKGIGTDPHPRPATVSRVRRIKEDSGLTWDQFRRLFGVSQRSVHLWASGARMSARNEERLTQIEQVVSALGLATPQQRRDNLLRSPTGGGRSIFQRLEGSAGQPAPVDIEALTESSGAGPTIHGEFLFAEEIGGGGEDR